MQIDDDEDMPVVHMRDGRSVRAQVVVGADGNRSACRSYVQGATEAEYVGAVVWRFFVPGDNPFVEVSDTLALTGGGKVLGRATTSSAMPGWPRVHAAACCAWSRPGACREGATRRVDVR